MNVKEQTILLAMVILLPACVFAGTYSGGTGEPNDPYLIATAEDLNDIGNHPEDFNKCFLMVADINLADYTGAQFNIIGSEGNPFTGIFDGADHTISNFTYTAADTSFIGIFGLVDDPNAVIKYLTLIDPNINPTGDSYCVGSLVGCFGYGNIAGCGVKNCNVSGRYCAGGLVGINYAGNISRCYAMGTILAVEGQAGGLVGTCNEDAVLLNCYSKGNISAQTGAPINANAGGLVGYNRESFIFSCFSNADVFSEVMAGGLVGTNWNSTIYRCYAGGTVSGTDWVGGGLVGYNNISSEIINCYATGIVSVPNGKATGGLVGVNEGYSSLTHCYAIGYVSGDENIGGLVGYNDNGSYNKCFWNSENNQDINGIGNLTDPNVIAETTENMKKQSTFTDAGWDFIEIWNIGENQTYPFLRTHPTGDIDHDDIVNFHDLAIIADHWLEGL